MQADDPPYLSVGTAVSAKYKGAFCEAKVSKVVRVVKCKVSYKNGLGTATVTDDCIKGPLRVGQLVQAKHADKKELVDATVTKIQDCSQYTVVFDDGDITTLRRTALCLKSGRHFNESETLDQLPLTHPEHFGNPVVGGRRGRRSRQLKEDSSDGEVEEENEPDLEQYSTETGRVVCVETSDKKRSRDNWFPGLVVMPSAQPTVRINVKDEYLIRSFKDGRYYTVPKKEVTEFTREMGSRVESSVLAEAVEKVLKYLDQDELPVHWEKNILFNMQSNYTDSEENYSDSSDDEPREEKDHFVAQLYKFMDDSGTPLNKSPTINGKDVDLYRMFTVVQKSGGYNRVTNQNKWRSVTVRLKFSNNQNTCNQVRLVYKKCLFSYESFYRTLGCTMLNHSRNTKKSRDRTLIRGKDRATPVQSPRPEKEEGSEEKKEEDEKITRGRRDVKNKEDRNKEEKGKGEKSKDVRNKQEKSKGEKSEEEQSEDELCKEEWSKEERSKEEKSKVEKGKEEKSKDGRNAEEKSHEEVNKDEKGKCERNKLEKNKDKNIKDENTKDEHNKDVKNKDESNKDVKSKDLKNKDDKNKSDKGKDDKNKEVKNKDEGSKDETVKSGKNKDEKSKYEKCKDEKNGKDDKSNEEKTKEDKFKEQKSREEKAKEKNRRENVDASDTNSGGDTTDQSEAHGSAKEVVRSKRIEAKIKDRKLKSGANKGAADKVDEDNRKDEKEDEKVQQTRSKSQNPKSKDLLSSAAEKRGRETKTPMRETPGKQNSNKTGKKVEEDKKRGRKKVSAEEKNAIESSTTAETTTTNAGTANIGDKLKVYYGPTHESKVTYEAKVIDIDESSGLMYLVHYTGWNNRYDEWIMPNRIAENLSATTKAKRLKQGAAGSSKIGVMTRSQESGPVSKPPKPGCNCDHSLDVDLIKTNKPSIKRGRGMSITGRSTIPDLPPRSTTPSSVTSSSSRTKSPATPATRNSCRLANKGEWNRRTRRTSVQTDISIHTDSESEESESESETQKTTRGCLLKSEETEVRSFRKKLSKLKGEKRKEDDDTEKEDEPPEKPKRPRRAKKTQEQTEREEESDDETPIPPPKGRDFDLNQIRSELKGFDRAVKINVTESMQKEATIASDDSSHYQDDEKIKVEADEKSEEIVEKAEASEDVYEFKEPEPFEFESRKSSEEKNKKRLVPRVLEDVDKSPKRKLLRSPKSETPREIPEIKKIYKKSFVKKLNEENEEDEDANKDPFDKLVESPSFHNVKMADRVVENKEKAVRVLVEDSGIFKEPHDSTEDECDEQASDNEDVLNEAQKEVFSGGLDFSASLEISPGEVLDSGGERKRKDSEEDDDTIRESIQRVLEQTTTDDDSNDGLSVEKLKYPGNEEDSSNVVPNQTVVEPEKIKKEEVVENVLVDNVEKNVQTKISPVFQESDTSLYEAICSAPQIIPPKIEEFKEINVIKTGAKIADSLLQKFGMIKKDPAREKEKETAEQEKKTDDEAEEIALSLQAKEEFKEDSDEEEMDNVKLSDIKLKKTETKPEIKKENSALFEMKTEREEGKKRLRKVLSREFVEESDSDSSSDSERRLVIARSDEDSQTSMSMDNKPDLKETDSNNSVFKSITDDSQTREGNSFDFSNATKMVPGDSREGYEERSGETETVKDDEADSHLHSLLLCEETIPGSPAPPVVNEEKVKSKNVPEMPFASAPGSSNNGTERKDCNDSESLREVAGQCKEGNVVDNTPPTSPESTLSNLSPRGDNGDLSPNTVDNESCKSNDGIEYSNPQRNVVGIKVSPYSEEDTLMNSEPNATVKKTREESLPSPCKKRRRSYKVSGSEDAPPTKRGRKPNRSRHNSDSDDTSEHSLPASTNLSTTTNDSRYSRSPRPRKYNFFFDFEGTGYDRTQRIAILTQKIQEIRKCYQEEKLALAAIEKRRKKIKRRQKENAKMAKQELMCA